MKNIKNYFKPANENPEEENNNSNNNTDNIERVSKNTKTKSNISQLPTEENAFEKPFHPSSSFLFPKTAFGKQNRSCQSRWFTDYNWLDYNEKNDSVTCFICKKHFNKIEMEKNTEEAFLSVGFRNWKKALDAFREHQKSKGHVAALTFEITIPKCGNVKEMTSDQVKKDMQENRNCLLKIIETLQFLGRQGLALRGEGSDENSNFLQLLKLRCKDFPKLECWLEKKSEKYTSHDIQNELLKLMAHQIINGMTDEMKDSFYAIICDEYTDISNKEQLTVCLRWVDDLFNVNEDFFGFYELEDIKSDTIVSAIKDVLLRTQIPFSNCRGQCYDGASNMLGKNSGVAKQILDIQPKAFVTHCHCHSLSLSVKDTTKKCKILAETLGTSGEIAKLIKYSPKREQKLESIKVTYEEEESVNRINKFSMTRWTVRANCLQRIIDNYCFLYKLWNECLSESGLVQDIKSRIIGCKAQMETFNFFFGLKLGKLLYSHTDKLSQTLQSEKMSAVCSKRLAMLTIETLSSLRNPESFEPFYDLCLKESQKIEFIEEPVLKRKRKEPRYSLLHYFDGYESTSEQHHPSSPRDHYRRVFYEAIDTILSSLRERFNQPSFLVFENLESLLIKSLNGEEVSDEMKFVHDTYGCDIDINDLSVELATLKVLMKGKQVEHFYDLIIEMKQLKNPEKKLLDNVCNICKILAVNPASSATAERTFSLARRVKNWMRSTMLPVRFNSIAILNFHKKRTDGLDLIKIANAFSQANDKRMKIFGRFTNDDL